MDNIHILNQDEAAKIDDMLCFALYATSRAVTDAYRPLLDKLGLTYPQYLVLMVLWEHQQYSVKNLGTTLHLDSGTLSPLLKRLESSGFIKRVRRANDERVVDISLTAEGETLKKRAGNIPFEVASKFGIERDEYIHLLASLRKLSAHLNTAE
jgi:DNA-binding MarR family transcriptional regulator